MFNPFLLGLAACSSLAYAVPVSQDTVNVASTIARRAEVESCPGYTASNVVSTDSSLTADLTLAGDACNAYSEDIKDLKLLVEYQTGEYLRATLCEDKMLTDARRRAPSCKDLRRRPPGLSGSRRGVPPAQARKCLRREYRTSIWYH
jgi:hypothetical protein